MNRIAEKEMAQLKKDAEYVGNEIKKVVMYMGHAIKREYRISRTRDRYR